MRIILIIILVLTGCDTGCIYRTETKKDGTEFCARVCPLEDANGDDKKDVNDNTIYGDPEEVNGAYCRAVSVSPTATATSSPTISPTAIPAK